MIQPQLAADLCALRRVSVDTQGGPMGYEDQERTFWLHGLGLSDD